MYGEITGSHFWLLGSSIYFLLAAYFFSVTSADTAPVHTVVNAFMFLVVQVFFLFILLGNFITKRPLINGVARPQLVAAHIEQHGLTGTLVQRVYKVISVLTYTVGPLSLVFALFFGKRI